MSNSIKLVSFLFIMLFTICNAFAEDTYLYVVRHGQTMFNIAHRAQGWSDTPLTKSGINDAEQLGRGLKDVKFVSVYSSDLGRARQTARIVLESKGDPVQMNEMEGLREAYFGQFEGDLDSNMWTPAAQYLGYQSDKELMTDFSQGKISLDKMLNAIAAVDKLGEAENYKTIKTRMQNSLKTIAEAAKAQGGGNVLIVSHGLAIMAMVKDLQDKPITSGLGNASVTKIRYTNNGKFIIESFGDMSYMEKGKKIN
ncbi:Phosphoglycerate/bisphosphoglycerate mutase [Gilliamella apicola]|uniref:histidine phosphatase family protein n=1 Tax=Gilliamella sp. wkB18 TaxID=3120260 RepID=UPI0004DD55BE|nr:histidine phosphatase family protein [Gilliamella apicola]KFA58597.1 Phosphoglycerate/bisphosphoglycerate mutase [Gilliamella apicola]